MSTQQNLGKMVDYKKKLASRFEVRLSEYQGNIYTHIRDSRIPLGQKKAKSITLHADSVLELSRIIPEIVAIIKKHNDQLNDLPASETEEEEEEVPPKKKRQWKRAEKN